jgi:putative glutamine amidotransferase
MLVEMPGSATITIPKWEAPTWERTQYYVDALEDCGSQCELVSEDELPADSRGLLLMGGVDVDPYQYGERRNSKTQKSDRRRDLHEIGLLRQALERDLPVLAICRGHQLLNVAFGGSLLQHIEVDGHRAIDDGDSRWHGVAVESGRLGAAYGIGVSLWVNSRHHQAVTPDRLSPRLEMSAMSADGYVEGMESRDHRWVVGVQWHPERPEMRADARPLFAAFVEACGE